MLLRASLHSRNLRGPKLWLLQSVAGSGYDVHLKENQFADASGYVHLKPALEIHLADAPDHFEQQAHVSPTYDLTASAWISYLVVSCYSVALLTLCVFL